VLAPQIVAGTAAMASSESHFIKERRSTMNAKKSKAVQNSKPTLLRDQSKQLKLKTGLKAGRKAGEKAIE